jgi:TonB family protein
MMKIVFLGLLLAVCAHAGEKKPVIMGGLDKSVVDETIKRHRRQISHCYSQELSSKADLAGRIDVGFEINKTGHVASAKIGDNTLNNEKVEKCVLGVINKMAFPKPQGGGMVSVSYPFVFAPSAPVEKAAGKK